MRVKRLEGILEECVSAHIEGRRSLEESLSLYPGLRSELEPLLRTALELKGAYQSASPTPAAQQRGLARFLSDARARRNLKTFSRQGRRSWFAGLLAPEYRMGLMATTAAVAVTVTVIGVASFGGGNGPSDDGGSLSNVTTSAAQTPAAVQNLQSQIDVIRTRISNGQQVSASDLEHLSRATRDLQNISAEDSENVATHIGPVIQDADDLLQTLVSSQPEVGASPEAQEAIDATRDVAAVFDVNLASPTAAAGPSDTPVVTGATTDVPTEAPTPAPTEPPTVPPEETPVPTPEPTEDRGLPGLSP